MEEAADQSEWRLRSGQYLGEISALCFLQLPLNLSSLPYLLAGSGSQILLYDLEEGKMIQSFHVFEGIRVHGLSCSLLDSTQQISAYNFTVVVFGERRIKLYNLCIVIDPKQPSSSCSVDLTLLHSLPKFSHWVLDVCFFKEDSFNCLAIGCGDNSFHLWDISTSNMILEVQSPERCLLYSMRLWGDNLESLRVASGTIYNEIIVWKVVPQNGAPSLTSPTEGHIDLISTFSNSVKLQCRQYAAIHVCKLVGHEGSIFRLAWSSNGCKLVSVSDDLHVYGQFKLKQKSLTTQRRLLAMTL